MSEYNELAKIKVEGPTVWIMSRIRFAVWNTVAARPIDPDAIPNASAAIFGEKSECSSREGPKWDGNGRSVQPRPASCQAGIVGA